MYGEIELLTNQTPQVFFSCVENEKKGTPQYKPRFLPKTIKKAD
jgi:hypothetical protein